MPTGLHLRRRLLAASAVGYAVVFALFLVFERPGLGIAHMFYIPIIVAAVGEAELPVLASAVEDAGQFAARLERRLESGGVQLTFGWATHPRDGTNALALFRAADERLYARKIVRGEWQPTAASAGLVE